MCFISYRNYLGTGTTVDRCLSTSNGEATLQVLIQRCLVGAMSYGTKLPIIKQRITN